MAQHVPWMDGLKRTYGAGRYGTRAERTTKLPTLRAPTKPMTNPFIERLAEAAYDEMMRRSAVATSRPITEDAWHTESQALRDDWCATVRAVLAAAREPSEEMISTSPHAVWSYVRIASWQAAIDAALSEADLGSPRTPTSLLKPHKSA